jgi:RNA polymerase sigma-70 factor (ECF subfamily)
MDQTAFRSFYQKTAPALRSYIARVCGSIDAADDILQEVFMRFLLKAPSGLSEAAMRGYLYRTAESLIVDQCRRAKREQQRDLEAARAQRGGPDRENDGDVRHALAQLKPQQRSLLWLAYVEEFDHREIAEAAGIKEKSVRVLLFRARRALVRLLRRPSAGPEVADAN